MSNLIGSSKTIDNQAMRARTSAAIRRVAVEKSQATGSDGMLAQAALLNPEFVIPAFLVHVTTNPAVAEEACVDCGYADVADGDILYIVTEAWAGVAQAEYPTEEVPNV